MSRRTASRLVLPILTWLRAYDRSDARFDLIAGAMLWGLLVPEAIAYAGLAGLPPEAGLYTLLAALAAYVVFGPHLGVLGAVPGVPGAYGERPHDQQ